jgi:hypothetical protein
MARWIALLLGVVSLAAAPRAEAQLRGDGAWLLGAGLASTAAGALAAGARSGDEAWLSAGVTTASFGAVDALLALGLLDLGGRTLAAITSDPRAPAEQADAERVAQYQSGQAFALNAGLDVAYLTAGALLAAFGSAQGGEAWQRGAGYALLGQGGFLFGFDLACWVRSNRRARTLGALFAPFSRRPLASAPP